jgi:Tfp pilus assembly protein PilO
MNSGQGTPLLNRVLAERRGLIVPLAGLLAINLLVYAVAVYPLEQRVANVQQRDRAAEQALSAARREYDAAQGALTGKDRAAAELATFYKDILPADLSGARRLTHLRLAQLARQSNLRYERSTYDPIEEQHSTLARFKIRMILAGSYADMRTFIYQLETSPEFVVIDNIGLAEGAQSDELVLTVDLSTYYRNVAR